MLIAPIRQLCSHSPQPLHRSVSRGTEVFFQFRVSKENRRNSHTAMHRPQPEQRIWSTWIIRATIH